MFFVAIASLLISKQSKVFNEKWAIPINEEFLDRLTADKKNII